MKHDFEDGNDCFGMDGIMDYFGLQQDWSTCSKNNLLDWYRERGLNCKADDSKCTIQVYIGKRLIILRACWAISYSTHFALREPISSQDTSGYSRSRLYSSGYVPALLEPIFRLSAPISSSGSESRIIVHKQQNFLVEVDIRKRL